MTDSADGAQTFRIVGVRHDGQRVRIIGSLDHGTAAKYLGELIEMVHEFKHIEIEADDV